MVNQNQYGLFLGFHFLVAYRKKVRFMVKKRIYARQEIEPVLQAYAMRGTYAAAAKELNKLYGDDKDYKNTAMEIVQTYRYDNEYAHIFSKMQPELGEYCMLTAEKAIKAIDTKLDIALESESKFRKLCAEIACDKEISAEERKDLIKTVRGLKSGIKLGELSSTLSTLIDKKRELSNENTDNLTVTIKTEGENYGV